MFSVFKSVFVCFFFSMFCVFRGIVVVYFYVSVWFFVSWLVSTHTRMEDESRPRTQTPPLSSDAGPDKGTFPRHFSVTFFYKTIIFLFILLLRSLISQRIMYGC